MRIRAALALAIALTVPGGGCSEDDKDDGGGGTRPLPCVPAAEQTPLLKLATLDGATYDIKADLCEKTVLVHFGATWCPPCSRDLPLMQELHEKYGDRGLRVVAVNVQEEIKLVRRFFTDLGVTFPVLHDAFGAYATFWDIDVIPTVILVSIEGEEVYRQVGYDENQLATLEDEILARLTDE